MSLQQLILVVLWVAITAYAVFGGADLGGGVLELVAGRSASQRVAISKAMGPVWEANHVWLIFFVIGLFSAFPRAFAAIGTALFVPLTLALVALVVRGASFAVAAQLTPDEPALPRLLRVFGAASAAAAFVMGAAAAALARGTLAHGHGPGLGAWISPFPLATGALAVATCAYLAATFLCAEVERAGALELVSQFRRRALALGTAVLVLAMADLGVAALAAHPLFTRLIGRGSPAVALGVAAGMLSLAATRGGHYRAARAGAAVAVAAIVWGWGIAQYPHLVGSVTVDNGAASAPALTAAAVAIAAGLTLVLPSLYLLYVAFRRQPIEVAE